MENKASGSKTRNTVYVAGLADEVNEQQLLDAFVTFGTFSLGTSGIPTDRKATSSRSNYP